MLGGRGERQKDKNPALLAAKTIALTGPLTRLREEARSGDEGGAKPPKLKGDAIMMVRPESSSAMVFWNGKRFELAWLGG